MQSVVTAIDHGAGFSPYTKNTSSYQAALNLEALVAHLKNTGKVCPKPWCWRRFWILFQPEYEPPWLSAWWILSTQEKRELFIKQLDYLAYHTGRFQEAYQFLRSMEDAHWWFEFEVV